VAQSTNQVTATARTGSGLQDIRATFLVGCDGAHSATRRSSGIGFSGSAFPQTFLIADLDVKNLAPDRLHVYMAEEGMMFFSPLGAPAPWRLLVMVPPSDTLAELDLDSAQAVISRYTRDPLVLHDPVWLTRFSVQSRKADRFRNGRIYLAGDAAHIHSPAGAQGMNTGIQDAINLGWKLALVIHGDASAHLLDSYESERIPVASFVLRMTNRAFRVATSRNPLLRFFRPRAAATAVPVALRIASLRRWGSASSLN
jgi:2-polyprenyl-6-methoxyphenol hydroxylase-like FAD-dependent oxidoreductase